MPSATNFQNIPFTPKNCWMPNTAIVRSEITSFASKANSLADQILSQNEPATYSGPVVIHDHHYYEPSYPLFWQPRPRVIVVDSPSCPRQCPAPSAKPSGKGKDDKAVFIGVAAAVIGGATLYSLGSSISAYQDAGAELEETNMFQHKLRAYQDTVGEDQQELVYHARQAASLKERICSRIQSSAATDIFLKSSMAAACGSALAGAAMEVYSVSLIVAGAQLAPALITGGAIAGCATAAGMLFKWGFDSTDKANLRDAQSLKDSVQLLTQK